MFENYYTVYPHFVKKIPLQKVLAFVAITLCRGRAHYERGFTSVPYGTVVKAFLLPYGAHQENFVRFSWVVSYRLCKRVRLQNNLNHLKCQIYCPVSKDSSDVFNCRDTRTKVARFENSFSLRAPI